MRPSHQRLARALGGSAKSRQHILERDRELLARLAK
jgi:hypothetical protein